MGGDGAAPTIARRKELRGSLVVGAATLERHAVAFDDLAMDQIVNRLADEGVAVEFFSQEVIAIDRQTTGRREAVRLVEVVESGERATRGKDFGGTRRNGNRMRQFRRREIWIAAHIAIAQDVVPGRIGVVAAEPIAGIVTAAAVLRAARLGVDLTGPRVVTEIAALNVDDLPSARRTNLAVAIAVGEIEPVIEPPR